MEAVAAETLARMDERDNNVTVDLKLTVIDFKLWSTHALKSFLAVRKKSVDGIFLL